MADLLVFFCRLVPVGVIFVGSALRSGHLRAQSKGLLELVIVSAFAVRKVLFMIAYFYNIAKRRAQFDLDFSHLRPLLLRRMRRQESDLRSLSTQSIPMNLGYNSLILVMPFNCWRLSTSLIEIVFLTFCGWLKPLRLFMDHWRRDSRESALRSSMVILHSFCVHQINLKPIIN